MENTPANNSNPLESLKAFTAARIALGRTGNSIPMKETLDFKLAHAHARDAVYSALAHTSVLKELAAMEMPVISVHSRAKNREQYLQRPDLGRLPDEESLLHLSANAAACDICIILADGLSATAINQNALLLLKLLIPRLTAVNYILSPVCLAEQARVAIGDYIAHALQARLSLVLIGERPGLSAADSMGAYLTYLPQPGLTDEMRNCVSNIRPGGLSFELAADKIFYLISEAFKRQLSGVQLKDNAGLLGE